VDVDVDVGWDGPSASAAVGNGSANLVGPREIVIKTLPILT